MVEIPGFCLYVYSVYKSSTQWSSFLSYIFHALIVTNPYSTLYVKYIYYATVCLFCNLALKQYCFLKTVLYMY